MLVNRIRARKALSLIKNGELEILVEKIKNTIRKEQISYGENYVHSLTETELYNQRSFKFKYEPLISIIVPVYNPSLLFLEKMLESVLSQTYKHWELCLANAGNDVAVKRMLTRYSRYDERIKLLQLTYNGGISENSNAALNVAKGDFFALLDHDDTLMPNALYEIVKEINQTPGVDLIYSDEDKVKDENKVTTYFDPFFKPDWSPYFFLGFNYLCHLTAFSKSLLANVGLFQKEYDGAQDYDLFLRLSEKANIIKHIPKVLYNWRVHANSTAMDLGAKPYAIEAGRKALEAHALRSKIQATINSIDNTTIYRFRFNLVDSPKVSIIIPNYNGYEMLEKCISSIIKKTTYKNYEILIIENNSNDQNLFRYYQQISNAYSFIKVLDYGKGKEFNYSNLNNWGRKFATGDYLLLLNNDTEIISNDWLESMLEYAQRDDVGCVGARLLYDDNTIQHTGMVLGIFGGAGHSFIHSSDNYPGYFSNLTVTREFSAVTGACLMVSTKLYDKVGGLEEKLAVEYGDVDFCLKMLEMGKVNLVVPYAKLYHYESKTRGFDDSPKKQARVLSEKTFFVNRWHDYLEKDPYYNVNLSLLSNNYSLK